MANIDHKLLPYLHDPELKEVKKIFHEAFRENYLGEFGLTPDTLSVNDVRILKLASKSFGVRRKPDKAIGE